jgi:DNA-binding SARP family transcriptional activator/DNA polymerase III delta prime subunit
METPGDVPADPGVTYRLLGPLSALRGAEPIELGPPKQRAVLALLLLNRGRVVSTDRLVDAVWGDEPPPSVLAGLQAYVSNLRRALRESAGASSPIVRRARGYVLDVPAEAVDVTAVTVAARQAREATEQHRWEEALALVTSALDGWRGELLEDLRDQPWVAPEAEGVDELRTECREIAITALLAVGRVAPALAAAQELLAAHPERDRACWLTMLALHRAGRSSDALERYRAHAAHLDGALGLEPGAELRELEVAILRHDPALAAWPRPAGWTGATQLPTAVPLADEPAATGAAAADDPAADGRDASIVGRERESKLLDDLLAESRGGRVRWLLLTGPAGIGKTRLAEELVERARARGGREAWARCSEEDGAPAWWPIRQLVRALAEDPDALLVPPAGVDPDEARFAVYERVAALLARAATAAAPLVVVVDDVQWADRTSARCLAYLAGALRGLPVVFALTLRDREDDRAVAPLLAALARSEGHRQLAVGPLGVADVRELVTRVAGESLSLAQADELAARTDGNPLFVCEYARLSPADRANGDVPLVVRTVLGRRLAGLDPEILQVLRAAAVIGDVLDVPTLAAVTGMALDPLADVLDEAADEHVIVPTPDTDGYAFAHGLLRDEVLAGLPALRRQRLHARVARALEDPEDGDRVSRRAQHLVAALPLADPTEVLEACQAAARVAEERWSSDIAAEWWAQALRVFDLQPAAQRDRTRRDELLVAQVAALARAGRGQTVLDVLDAGLLDAVRAGAVSTVGRLAASLLRSAGAWPWTSYGEDPGRLLERLEGLESFVAQDAAAHVRLLGALAVGRCYDADTTVPDRLSTAALERAEALGDPEVLADALLGRLITYSGVARRAPESVEIARRLIDLPHAEARVDAAVARSVASMAHFTLGDVDAAADDVRAAIAESDVLSLPVIRVQLRWMEGTLALWHGDTAAARRHYEAAGRIHAQTELYYAGSAVLAGLALVREEGGLAAADTTDAPEPLVWRAAVAAARGDAAAAGPQLDAWLDAVEPWVWATLGHVALAAHAAADAGLADRAPRIVALLEPYSGRLAGIGHVGAIGSVDLALGRLHALLGHRERAAALLREALEQAQRTGGAPTARRCREALAELG